MNLERILIEFEKECYWNAIWGKQYSMPIPDSTAYCCMTALRVGNLHVALACGSGTSVGGMLHVAPWTLGQWPVVELGSWIL